MKTRNIAPVPHPFSLSGRSATKTKTTKKPPLRLLLLLLFLPRFFCYSQRKGKVVLRWKW